MWTVTPSGSYAPAEPYQDNPHASCPDPDCHYGINCKVEMVPSEYVISDGTTQFFTRLLDRANWLADRLNGDGE